MQSTIYVMMKEIIKKTTLKYIFLSWTLALPKHLGLLGAWYSGVDCIVEIGVQSSSKTQAYFLHSEFLNSKVTYFIPEYS